MVDKAALTAALTAVAPCIGVTCPDVSDRSTWRVDFNPAPTDAQRQAAAGVIANWKDPVSVLTVTSKQVLYALNHLGARMPWDTAWTAQKQDDRDWFGLGGDPFPVSHKRIVRMLGVAGVDVNTVMSQAANE